MNDDDEVVQMARTLIVSYRDGALVISERRAECCSCAGDRDGLAFWRGVAEAIREIEAGWW